jgi:hypothetical protein
MLIESDSSGVCILKITNHPQTLINTGFERFFCFHEYSVFVQKSFFPSANHEKSRQGFFEYSRANIHFSFFGNQRSLMKHRIDAIFLKTEVMASQLLQSQMERHL